MWPPNSPKTVFRKYGFSLALVALAAAIHIQFRSVIDGKIFLFFYPSVFLGALVGGLGPGLLSTLIASIFVLVFLVQPVGSLRVESIDDIMALVVFFSTGVLFSFFSGSFQTLRDKLASTRDDAMAVFASNPVPLLVINSDLRIKAGNKAFYETFQVCLDETENRLLSEFGYGEWSIPTLIEAIQKTFTGGVESRGIEVEHDFPTIGRKFMILNAQRFRLIGSRTDAVILSIEDYTERKKIEFELKEAQRVARLGSWSWDIKNDIVTWSEELYRIHGLEPGTTAPRYAEHPNLYTKESMQRLDEAVRKVQSEGTPYEIDLEVIRPDGTTSWILARGEAVRNKSGHIIATRGTALDISTMKQAEQKLKESESNFRTLTEAMPQIVWATNPDGWATYTNQQWVAYTGLTLQESYGHGWNKTFHPDDRKRAWDAWQNAMKTEDAYSLECRLRRKDGVYRWWLIRSLPLHDENGKIMAWFGTCTDIDEIKRAEAALKISEEKYRSLIASAYDGVMIINKDGIIQYANRQIEKLFGYSPDELIGQDYQVLIPEQDRQSHLGLHDRYVADPSQRKMGTGLHIFARRKDGSIFPADISLNPFESDSELLVNCIVRDITEQRKFEEDRQQLLAEEKTLKEAAVNANRVKDEFLSTLSHELRTPLTTILGWSQEVLSKNMHPEVVNEGLSVIEKSAQAQSQLIDDLLDVSRIQAGKMSLDIRVIDLVEVLELAVASARIPAEKKSLQIEMALSVSSCKVSADPIRLQQVFWNLLTNAIKFTPRGGKIFVKLNVIDGDQAQVQITDTGMGIKPEFLGHIFERFNQADSSTTRTFGGLGLGLAIVKSLVEMQKGTVKVKSDGEGKGACFTVFLPLLQRKAVSDETELKNGQKMSPENLKGIKILVVDDNDDNLRLFSVMLKSMGSEVRLADSAREALDVLPDFKPDILLSDISMPGEDGYSLIQKIRALSEEQGGKTPAVALTAYADNDSVRKAIVAGFSAHVAKPVEKLKLAGVISELVKTASVASATQN